MPKIRKGESQSAYVGRCVPKVMKEGKTPGASSGTTQKQALGKCYGMSRKKR